MALLPELQPAPETLTFSLQDGEIRTERFPPSVRQWHVGQALVRRRQGARFERHELGVNLDPAAGVFRVPSLGVLAFQEPIRIDRVLCRSLRIHV